jgi:hypothetical protein
VDAVGSVLASFLGLNQSRYQYEIDYARRQREDIRRQIIMRRQRELLEREERTRDMQRRAGHPLSEKSVAQTASDAYQREEAALAASGRDVLDEAVRSGALNAEDVPPEVPSDVAAAALSGEDGVPPLPRERVDEAVRSGGGGLNVPAAKTQPRVIEDDAV